MVMCVENVGTECAPCDMDENSQALPKPVIGPLEGDGGNSADPTVSHSNPPTPLRALAAFTALASSSLG